jgi:CheY-like chemotaxis protein
VKDTGDAQAAHSAGLILECGQHLLAIIQEILDYSVLQAGRTRLEPRPHVLTDLLSPVLRQVAVTTREKSLELSYWLPPHLPATIVTDGRRLQQILLNLLQNATKFTDRGGVHLNVAAAPRPNGEWQWTFAVFDSGSGIGAEGLKRIFNPFSQGTDPARYGGTGLGLAISQSFARLMGGDVRARSLLGRGSCFRCTIRTPAPDAGAGQVADLAPAALQGAAITLVSRPTRTARLLAATLRSWGLQPTLLRGEAWQGAAALPGPAIIEHGEVDPASVGRHPVVWLERAGEGRAEPAAPNQLALPVALSDLRDALQHLLAPVVAATAAESPRARAPASGPDARLAQRVPLHILAADDIRTNREALRIILRLFGYEITVVNDGIDVLRALDRHSYDLVLLDVQMPGMDGLAAARQIVNRYPDAAKRPKLIAITAGALPGDRAACLAAGMDDYLAKPVLPDAIERCILRHFTEQSPPPAAPPASPNRPLVDTAHLAAALPRSLGVARVQILRGMRNAVALDYTTLRVDLDRACTERNAAVLGRTLHALKGCFLTIGWARLAHFCASQLAEVRADTFTGWATLPDQLRELYAESQDAMQHHVGDTGLPAESDHTNQLP